MEFIIYGLNWLNCETYGSLWVYAYAQSMGPSDSDSGAGNETGRPRVLETMERQLSCAVRKIPPFA